MSTGTSVCSFCSKPIRHLDSASIARGEPVHLRCHARAASEQVMSEATPPRPQKVIIVERGRADAPEAARDSHGVDVSIIVDRRTAERRQGRRSVTDERRGRDRRAPLMEPEEMLWRGAGYRIVYRAGDARD